MLKMSAVLAGASAFVALGVSFAVYREEWGVSTVLIAVCTYVGVPFFGLCAIYALYRLIARRPSVVIDEQGITDNASSVAVGLIRWEEIAEVFTYDYMGQQFLGIVPTDAESVLARANPLSRMLSRASHGLIGAPINISSVALPISVDELLQHILHFTNDSVAQT